MTELIIGTDGGAYRLEDGIAVREDTGPAAVAFLAAAGGSVYGLTPQGSLWLRPAGGAWRLEHERTVDDEVWSFAADARLPGRLYLGVSPALLYRSDDGGASWVPCDSIRRIPGYERWTFPPPPHIPHVRSIAPDPRAALPGSPLPKGRGKGAAGAVYIGVEEGGVYRSDDGGETWESLNEGLYWDVHAVAPAPDGPALYATTGGGFYRSEDGGRRWERATSGLDRTYTVSLAVSAELPDRLYIAAAAGPPPTWRGGANAALYRSNDGGATWARLERGLPGRFDSMVTAISLGQGNAVYAAAGPELYTSHDGGESWSREAGDLPRIRALAAV